MICCQKNCFIRYVKVKRTLQNEQKNINKRENIIFFRQELKMFLIYIIIVGTESESIAKLS